MKKEITRGEFLSLGLHLLGAAALKNALKKGYLDDESETAKKDLPVIADNMGIVSGDREYMVIANTELIQENIFKRAGIIVPDSVDLVQKAIGNLTIYFGARSGKDVYTEIAGDKDFILGTGLEELDELNGFYFNSGTRKIIYLNVGLMIKNNQKIKEAYDEEASHFIQNTAGVREPKIKKALKPVVPSLAVGLTAGFLPQAVKNRLNAEDINRDKIAILARAASAEVISYPWWYKYFERNFSGDEKLAQESMEMYQTPQEEFEKMIKIYRTK